MKLNIIHSGWVMKELGNANWRMGGGVNQKNMVIRKRNILKR